ncbi:MAG: glycosyltransferase family 4 protein [Symploca sp. SIO2E9]|nr:glycosyltransferase family 4 protein [Symploca sp. SIO2E9]
MEAICHLTSVHSPQDIRIFHKECRILLHAGYQVSLVVPYVKDEKVDGIKFLAVCQPHNRWERMTRTLFQIYRKSLVEEATIYHFHDPELILIGLLLKARGKKVIYDVHEDVPRQILSKAYIPKSLRHITAWIVEMIENFAVKHFDGVVTATPFIRDRFLKLGCHAVDVNNYPILSELNLSNVDFSQKERAVCYVGGISDIRGIFEMIEAIGKTDAKLLLAGKFANRDQRNQALAMPGWTNVQELGQLNRDEVAQTLARSLAGLVVLHPIINYIDALPVKMFEYMAAGIPVIASNFPLWRDIVEGNQCGICVDSLAPKAIAEAIEWIVDHPKEAKSMGENGRKAVEEKYNWETEAKKLCSLYSELLL